MHSSDTLAQYGAIIKGPFAVAGLASIIAFVWLIGTTTRFGWPRVPLAFTFTGVGLAIVNFLSPGGLIVDSVTGFREVSLFGEAFVVHEPNASTWRFLLDGFLVVVTFYFFAAVVHFHRRQGGGPGALLIGSAIVLVVTLFDSLVDAGVVDTPYLSPFGMIAFSLALAIQHTKQVIETELTLVEHSVNLEDLVTIRTESLHAANARVVDELAHQAETVSQLTRLTRQSIELGTLGLDSPRSAEDGLGEVLTAMADIIGASSVKLVLEEASPSELAGLHIERWASDSLDFASGVGAAELQYTLGSSDHLVGRLVVRGSVGQPFSRVQQQLAKLSAELLTAAVRRMELESALVTAVVDDERRRIARDLHDSLSQRLYAAAFHADALTTEDDHDAQLASAQAQTIRDLVLSSLAEMRTLLFELQPETFDATSFNGLVEQLCESMGQVYGRPIDCQSRGGPTVPRKPKLALYRILQESVGNALRHAKARHVFVTVQIDAQSVELEVSDDGVGFEPHEVMAGQGLRNLAERARQIGATIDVSSAQDVGTTISVAWLRDQTVEPQIDLTDAALTELAGS
jgi:signal transduction histidine kinase